MNDASILILALAVQQMLFAAGWWLSARELPESRFALRQWAGFCGASAMALFLFTEPARAALGGAAVMLRNAGIVLAFVLLRRGLLGFLRSPLREREQWGLFVACLAVMAWLGTAPESAQWRTAVLSAVLSWLLWRAAFESHRGRAEFGVFTVGLIGLPLALVGSAMAARGTLALALPQSGVATLTQATQFNVAMLLALVVLTAVFHFTLGYLVMSRMMASLRHLSSHDSLTALPNRRAFEQRLLQEIAASRRTELPLGLLMIDVDHFKRINDRFGHAGGDLALRRVADRLAQAARGNDVVARLGGEEFGVLLPATDAAGIRQAAERLRRAVGGQPLEIEGEHSLVTVSVGASMRLTEEHDAQAMLRRADQALYRAKGEGRDRVVFDTLAQVSDTPPRPDSRAVERG
jgi:diguanylate cyclase (GGDEF)-like protein